ncbi:MAG TPA: MarR family transcriptional regulator [Longimicrobium sp.]|nr:MarR family transcriptional regulator [Longimicrobium sp.]
MSQETDRALKLWVVLSRAHAAVAAHSQADIARSGLTPAEFGILEALHHKGPMLLGEVQKKILVTSGGVTYLVDRLAAKGLVERQRCDRDRRAYYAALTPAGRELIQEIFPRHAEAIRRAMEGLTEEEKDAAIPLVRALGTHAARTEPEGGE